MKKIGVYKRFKLYEIVEHDIVKSGGADSRYVKGSIVIFLPDDERPQLGYEEWEAGSRKEAEDFIDSYGKDEKENESIKSRIEAAKILSQSQQNNRTVLQDIQHRIREDFQVIREHN